MGDDARDLERSGRGSLPSKSGWRLLGVLIAKCDYLRFGSYPVAERWRVDAVEAIGAVLIVWLLWTSAPRRAWARSCFLSSIRYWRSFFCADQSFFGLPVVDTLLWGGFSSRLSRRLVEIVFSLPLGVLLALAVSRRFLS